MGQKLKNIIFNRDFTTGQTSLLNKWQDFNFNLVNQGSLINNNLIIESLKLLWDKIEYERILDNKDNLILIQFKIKLLNSSYRSISYLQTVKFNDFNDLSDIFIELWSLRDEDYTSLNPSHIVYAYKIINDPSYKIIITTKINKSK